MTTAAVPVSLRAGRPLTPMQRALWASQRLHPDAPVQNMALLTHLDGPIEPDRLAAAFETVVRASDVLRTRIVIEDGSPLVRIGTEPPQRISGAAAAVSVARADAERWARDRVQRPLDPSECCYDSVILVHDDDTVSWYLDLHHVITDATSSSLVFDATAAAYGGDSIEIAPYYPWAERSCPRPDGDADVDSRTAKAMAHWRQRRPAPGLARLYRPVTEPQAEADRLDIPLDDELVAAIDRRLADDYKLLSPDLAWTALLMTATAAYVHHVAGSDSFSIGLPVHNRSAVETRSMIGPIMEVFPVDVAIEPGQTFRTLHKAVSRSIMATLGRATVGTAPGADYAAVVNVIPRAGVGSFGPVEATTRWIHSGAIDSSHLLRVQLTAYDGTPGSTDGATDGPTLALDLNRAAADDAHRRRAPDHFATILASMVADPDRFIARPILTEEENRLVAAWESAPDFETDTPNIVAQLRSGLATNDRIALTRRRPLDDRSGALAPGHGDRHLVAGARRRTRSTGRHRDRQERRRRRRHPGCPRCWWIVCPAGTKPAGTPSPATGRTGGVPARHQGCTGGGRASHGSRRAGGDRPLAGASARRRGLHAVHLGVDR